MNAKNYPSYCNSARYKVYLLTTKNIKQIVKAKVGKKQGFLIAFALFEHVTRYYATVDKFLEYKLEFANLLLNTPPQLRAL